MQVGEMLGLVNLALAGNSEWIYAMQIDVTIRPHCPSRR